MRPTKLDSIRHKAGRADSVGEREAVFIASTAAVDRTGDVVEQNWDFRAFRGNPVLAFQHRTSELPIGKVTDVWTDKAAGITYARAEAPPAGLDEFVDRVWQFIKEGFLSAVSVGFRPIADPEPIRDDLTNALTGFRYPKSELLELSVVSVPANSEAVVVARSLGMSEEYIQRIFDRPEGVSARAESAPRVHGAKRFAEIARLRVSIQAVHRKLKDISR